MPSDFHLHTFVSDGELDPVAVLRHAAACGVDSLSITDHDALGAYRWREGEVFAEAERLHLQLTVGIEMDADWDGTEIHLLGFGLSLADPRLNAHLEAVREARVLRARQEISLVNGLLGEGTITADEVFVPERETLMKPHFIRPLLAKGRFATYEEANTWYRRSVKAEVKVPKPRAAEAIALLKQAGGWTALAHPGYYGTGGTDVVARLGALVEAGLDGLEVDYPYHACSPHRFTADDAHALLAAMHAAAESLGLRVTAGSDCHTAADFGKVYGRV